MRPQSGRLPKEYLAALQEAVSHTNVLLGSGDHEINVVTGIDDSFEAARSAASPDRTVVLRLGKDGAYVVPSFDSGQQGGMAPAFDVEVKSTLGAGDVFNAGFIAGQLRGEDLLESARWGSAAAAGRLLDRPDRPSVIVADSDLLAAGVYVAARERQIEIPNDLAVTGFDDIDLARLMEPELTTVAIGGQAAGKLAVEAVRERLAGTIDREISLLPVHFTARASTLGDSARKKL